MPRHPSRRNAAAFCCIEPVAVAGADEDHAALPLPTMPDGYRPNA